MSTFFTRPTFRSLPTTLLVSLVLLPTGIVEAEDWIGVERQSARSWGMHRIAVHQAAGGDVQGAKRTLSQIDDYGPKRPSRVTVVSFWNRQPICAYECQPAVHYDAVPARDLPLAKSPGWGGRDTHGTQYFLAGDRPADHLPSEFPVDLPLDYLDPDPRHGAVVDFADEYDGHGTRVTSRKYTDGHMVIETPRMSGT